MRDLSNPKADAPRVLIVEPERAYLGVLGMPGTTAWVGVTEIGQPRPGETFVVAAASGAVGGVAGQIARAMGCRVVEVAAEERHARTPGDQLTSDDHGPGPVPGPVVMDVPADPHRSRPALRSWMRSS